VASEGSWLSQRTSLLIVRTRRVFTRTRQVARDTRMSQHIASCTDGITSAGGNKLTSRTTYCPFESCHLRTVIVTAAVYRGLDSRLRPKANLSS
jgi:hypothetical protein